MDNFYARNLLDTFHPSSYDNTTSQAIKIFNHDIRFILVKEHSHIFIYFFILSYAALCFQWLTFPLYGYYSQARRMRPFGFFIGVSLALLKDSFDPEGLNETLWPLRYLGSFALALLFSVMLGAPCVEGDCRKNLAGAFLEGPGSTLACALMIISSFHDIGNIRWDPFRYICSRPLGIKVDHELLFI